MGSVYRRKWKDQEGNHHESRVWWIKYYRDGKPYRESSGSSGKGHAKDLLKKREGAIAGGTFTGLLPEKTRLDDLAADLLNDYRNNEKKALPMVESYVERLKVFFGGVKANQITTDRIRAYVAERKQQKDLHDHTPANATINREMAALKRMFNLGKQAGKVVTVPHIPMLAENNVRKGFFHHRDYLRLKSTVRPYLKPVITLAYFSGMRQGEILGLQWSQVDLRERTIRLNPGTTKNKEPRLIPMSEELYNELRIQKAIRDERFPSCEHVFFNHSTGKPIKDHRKAWESACDKLGLDGALFHDFRRAGVRNLVRAGVPEKVAMAISGHKTRSVFDRYNIVSEEDLKAAAKAVESYLQESTAAIQSQITEIDEARNKNSGDAGTVRAQVTHSDRERQNAPALSD